MSELGWQPISAHDFRQKRRQLGHTQARLAKLFGVTPLTVTRWESGKYPITESAQILMYLLWDEVVNGNRHAMRDFMKRIKLRAPPPTR